MEKVTCVGLIPAESVFDPATGLNVLVMAVNGSDRALTQRIALFGKTEGDARLLITKECPLAPGEHAHLYFHIPKDCFAPEFWDGEAPEEITLYAGTEAPETSGNLVFIESTP